MSKTKTILDSGAVTLKRAKNSYYGNPAYYVDFSNGVCVISGKTAANYSFCYEFNTGYYKNVKVEYHTTPSGRVVFTNIKRVTEND